MPKCACGCGEQVFVFMHCAGCFQNKQKSDAVVALLFDEGIELYCSNCGCPVYKTWDSSFHFSNILQLSQEQPLVN